MDLTEGIHLPDSYIEMWPHEMKLNLYEYMLET